MADDLYKKLVTEIPNSKQFKLSVLKNKNLKLYDEVMEKTKFLPEDSNLSLRSKFIKENIKTLLICSICGKEHIRIDKPKWCSLECFYKDKNAMKKRVSSVNQSSKVAKMKATNKKKYGHEINSQRDEIKEILSNKMKNDNPAKRIPTKEKIRKTLLSDTVSSEIFELSPEKIYQKYHVNQNLSCVEISKELNTSKSWVEKLFKNSNLPILHSKGSNGERELLDKIQTRFPDLKNKIERNNRSILKKEIDIWIPEYNLGIEYHGSYWHSEKYVPGGIVHQEKAKDAIAKGITLLQFFDAGNLVYIWNNSNA